MATTRNYTRDSTRKHFKYDGDDISSRIFENLSCIIHMMTSGNISYINDNCFMYNGSLTKVHAHDNCEN